MLGVKNLIQFTKVMQKQSEMWPLEKKASHRHPCPSIMEALASILLQPFFCHVSCSCWSRLSGCCQRLAPSFNKSLSWGIRDVIVAWSSEYESLPEQADIQSGSDASFLAKGVCHGRVNPDFLQVSWEPVKLG